MDSHILRINRNMITGWMIIVTVLLVTYSAEVLKGERTLGYLLVFIPLLLLPAIFVYILYRKRPDWNLLCYFIVVGYFILYIFVMITGKSIIVCTYILPMLSFLVLSHHPRLVLGTGIASLIVNIISIVYKFHVGILTMATSDQAEIEIALIILCFSGSYIAARLYDDITKQNSDYLAKLNATNEEFRHMSLQTITTIARMLDAKDSYTEGHSQRVSAYSACLAKELGMPEDEVENLRKVGLLHDIGKVGVSDLVLNKPGRLTEEEFAAMKQHTTVGGEIIMDVKTIPNLYDGVRYHHERYDGKGYPEGRKGEDIPYIARIIAVADAYDAMTSTRVYRKYLPMEKVLSELEKGAGTQFDPIIARKMIELVNAGVMMNLSPDMAEENKLA